MSYKFTNHFENQPQMKKFNLTLLAGMLAIGTHAQTIDYQWAKTVGSGTFDSGQSITLDASGNVYTCGYFNSTVDFDPGPGTAIRNSNGDKDIFIQKLDANGNFLWVKTIGGPLEDFAEAITIDPSGNLFITGFYEGTVDFDPGAGTTYLTSNGDEEIFVSKLDSNGNLLWAKSTGGTDRDGAHAITTDAFGNVYTTGHFRFTVDFDPGPGVFNLSQHPTGYWDCYIQKLDGNGNFVWARAWGGSGSDDAHGISSDPSGNIYTTGFFGSSADFDPTSGTTTLSSNGGQDVFVQKLDANGNFLWAKSFGSGNNEFIFGLATDGSGNVYTTGQYQGTVDFDPGAGVSNLVSSTPNDVFISKLDANGDFVWAKSVGGTGNDAGICISTDATGNVYTTGQFGGVADLDPNAGVANFTSNGSDDMFILKLTSSGNFEWAVAIGGTLYDSANDSHADASGNVYVTGHFQSTTDFDPNAGTVNITSNGATDIFVLKLGQCTPTGSTNTVVACDSYTWIDGVTYTSSNNTATHTLSTTAGCDSIVSLDLTILNSATGTDVITSLNPIVWIDGNTYTTSNNTATHNIVGGAANGCDSLVTLDLTIVDCSFFTCGRNNQKILVCHNGIELCISPNAVPAHLAHGDECGPCFNQAPLQRSQRAKANSFAIYPNPFTNSFVLESNHIEPTEYLLLTIFDLTGRELRKYRVVNSQMEIDLGSESNGIYFYSLTNETGMIATGKLIKK